MKPPPFTYFDPRTLDEALGLLHRRAEEAKILAGGQSLMPLMNFRLARPRVIVDVNRLPGLDGIVEADGMLRLGALVRQSGVETSELVRMKCPLLAEATHWVGHPAIRSRGTVGGVIAHSDPAAEYLAVLTALDGEVVVRSRSGERVAKPDDFFVTFLTTSLAPDEMVTEVRFPTIRPEAGCAFVEFSRRHGDFAIVGVAAIVELDEGGKCGEARIALCGVGGAPFRARDSENMLKGEAMSERTIEAAADRVGKQVNPESDLHGSAEYRKHLARVLTRRALGIATERARKNRSSL
jgi:CO/xanthine dehydrogenase FAD-binding subunit